MKIRLVVTIIAVVLTAGAAGWFLVRDGENPRFRAVTNLAGDASAAALSGEPPSATQRLSTTTSTAPTTTAPEPTTTSAAPPPTTTAVEPPQPPPPPPSSSTTVDLSRADEYGCTHANGCLPYGGDGQTSGDAQHEWGCEQGYITEGC